MFTRISTEIIDWLALPVLLVIIVLLVRRKTGREFPNFFFYLLVIELAGIARLLVWQLATRNVYYYAFWISDVLMAFFTFFVVYELFVRRLFPRFFAIPFYRYMFPIAGLIIAFTVVPAALANRKVSLLLALIHGLEILQVTVLLFFVTLMVFMGRHWTRYEFSIAFGIGLQASSELIATANWAKDLFTKHLTDDLPLYAFDIACLIWLITFLKPEKPVPTLSGPISPEVLTEARKWQESAKGSITKKRDSE